MGIAQKEKKEPTYILLENTRGEGEREIHINTVYPEVQNSIHYIRSFFFLLYKILCKR